MKIRIHLSPGIMCVKFIGHFLYIGGEQFVESYSKYIGVIHSTFWALSTLVGYHDCLCECIGEGEGRGLSGLH